MSRLRYGRNRETTKKYFHTQDVNRISQTLPHSHKRHIFNIKVPSLISPETLFKLNRVPSAHAEADPVKPSARFDVQTSTVHRNNNKVRKDFRFLFDTLKVLQEKSALEGPVRSLKTDEAPGIQRNLR